MNRLGKWIGSFIILVALLITIACIIVKIASMPRFYVSDGVLRRDLVQIIFVIENDPVEECSFEEAGKNYAWNSELPNFIWQDFEYAKQYGLEVEYKFKENLLKFIWENEKWQLTIQNDSNLGRLNTQWENVSLYQTQNKELVVYGYNSLYGWFQKITFGQNECNLDTISYDTNIPLVGFTVEDTKNSIKLDEMSMVRKGEIFYFLKDGKCVSIQEFKHGTINDIDIRQGLLITEEGTIYAMYIRQKSEKPLLNFAYIGIADSIVHYLDDDNAEVYIEGENIAFPLVSKQGKYYVLIPNDWETYTKYFLAKVVSDTEASIAKSAVPFDYSMVFLDLEEGFERATFHYSVVDKDWKVQLTIEFDGKQYTIWYRFGGYDNSAKLDEDVVKLFEMKMSTSLADMQEMIEKIRKTYFDYYEHSGDFVPAVTIGR